MKCCLSLSGDVSPWRTPCSAEKIRQRSLKCPLSPLPTPPSEPNPPFLLAHARSASRLRRLVLSSHWPVGASRHHEQNKIGFTCKLSSVEEMTGWQRRQPSVSLWVVCLFFNVLFCFFILFSGCLKHTWQESVFLRVNVNAELFVVWFFSAVCLSWTCLPPTSTS